jgi:hypothetical protein
MKLGVRLLRQTLKGVSRVSHFTLEMLVGAAFIVLYSYGRFNSPPTNRSSTTAFRYHLGATVYTLTILTFYSILASVRPMASRIYGDQPLPDLLQDLSDPLLAALLLTVLLPNTPWLSEIDLVLRRKTQKMASIPYEVRRLSQELRRLPLELSDELRRLTRAELIRQGLDEADIFFDGGDMPQHRWAKISALVTCLRGWETDARFVAFTLRFSNEWTTLQKDHERLAAQAGRCFRFAREAADHGIDERAHELAADYVSSFDERAEHLLDRLYDFVAHAVLDCEFTLAARRQRLAKLGWRMTTKVPPDVDTIVGIFLLLFLVTITCLVIGGQFAPQRVIQLAVIISTSYIIAVLSSLTLKQRRGTSAARGRFRRPWASYVIAGMVAVGAASLLNATYRLALTLSDPQRWLDRGVLGLLAHTGTDFVTRGAPWLLVAFGTAFGVAYHLDSSPSGRWSGKRLRILETCTQGLLTALAALGAWWLLGTHAPPVERVIILAAALGLMIGLIVPTAFREAIERSAAIPPTAEPVAGIAPDPVHP